MSGSGRIHPRKALGQHWLVDRNALERISATADFSAEDTVVEVGAGTGLLTELLAQRARRLIAVELDAALAEGLRRRFAGSDNVCVIEGDVLSLSPEEILSAGEGRIPYVVIGNLPYFIGTAIVRRFLHAMVRPRWLVVMLQAEVAESIAAPPGQMTYLAVETQIYASAQLLFHLPPKAFKPPPKVRSTVLRLDVRDVAEIEVDDREALLRLVHAGFAAPRKRIRNSLAIGLRVPPPEAEAMLSSASIDPGQRPSHLALDDWRRLYMAHRSYLKAAAG